MKPKKFKLSLNKETIAKLDDSQMRNLNGGIGEVVDLGDVGDDAEARPRDSMFFCNSTKNQCRTYSCKAMICIPLVYDDNSGQG